MRVFAVGEVVRPSEPILKIVAADADLMVMAQLEPINVDQVHAGQDAAPASTKLLKHSVLTVHVNKNYVRLPSFSTGFCKICVIVGCFRIGYAQGLLPARKAMW